MPKPKKNEQPEHPPIQITSFDDLAPREVMLEFESGGRVYQMPCKELSYDDFWQIERDVPDPAAPVFEGPAGRLYDVQDAGYQRAKSQANQERHMRRILAMLPFPIPGDTTAEKTRNLSAKTGLGFIDALTKALNKIQFSQEARIDALADSFPGIGDGNESHSNGARLVAGAVGELAEG